MFKFGNTFWFSTTISLYLGLTTNTIAADFSTLTNKKNAGVEQSTLPEVINNYNFSVTNQVTPVSQLVDIKTTDWSFQALNLLIERYEIKVNFDDNLWSNHSLNRYQFATLIKITIDHLTHLIIKKNSDLVRQEDLATIQRLQSEFAMELATLSNRVNNLEIKTNQLATQQFSPTAKLTGEAILAISSATGNKKADDNDEEVEENLILSDRVWLNFDLSFTGSDRLFVRLEAENTPDFADSTGTEMARLGFAGDSDNEFDINQLEYNFPISKAADLYITSDANDIQRVANSTSSFGFSGSGAISRFGRYSPIYRLDFGAAVRLKYEFNDDISFSIGLASDDADDEDDAASTIGGDTDGAIAELNLELNDVITLDLAYQRDGSKYGAIAQLRLEPIDDIELGFTCVRFYDNLDTGTGSELANDPFNNASDRVTTNSYGVEANIQVSADFTLGGWLGVTEATAQDISSNPEATIFHYAVTLAFSDLGKEDSLLGIVFGQPPKVTSNDFGREYTDRDTSLHLELFYRYQATDNIAITPGLLVITNPEHNTDNSTLYIGTIRTTLRF